MMEKTTKNFTLKGIDEAGTGLARIAVLDAVDLDGDTYAAGAFGDQDVVVLDGHKWSLPMGKGRVFERGNEALVEFKLNLETTAGREMNAVLKFDMENGTPLQEWSYGFNILESDQETRDGKSVRVLKSLDVFEVSPVILGAGVGTGTIAIKSRSQFLTEANDLLEFADRLADERKAEGKEFRPAWLDQIKALTARMNAFADDLDAVPNDDAELLLAEYTAIRYGRIR